MPNRGSNDVSVIDPATMQVVDTFDVGVNPQHIVPSWDLKTLWVTNNAEGRTDGTLTPVDPKTGKPRDRASRSTTRTTCTSRPTASRRSSSPRRASDSTSSTRRRCSTRCRSTSPDCAGINHADFAIDGTFAIFTCEFQGSLVKIDIVNHTVLGYLTLSGGTSGMPQDIRVSPDGSTFYVAEMMRGGVYTIDPYAFTETGFIPTGIGTHGLYPEPPRQQALRRQPRAGPRRGTTRGTGPAACR